MKTRIVIGVSLIVVVLAMANLSAGQAQRTDGQPAETGAGFSGLPAIEAPGARFNPLKIALLHWYQLNRTTQCPVGSQPDGVCFDGANIWTANFGDGTVTKLRASDGQVLGTFSAGGAFGVTFDG